MPTHTSRPASTRRRAPVRPDTVDHAYDHCLVVLGDPAAAATAAARAASAGRRSRPSTLAHARHAALSAAANPPAFHAAALDGDAVELGPGVDLVRLARALASTRPPVERAVVDLDTRHDLDRAGLGRALGLPPSAAAARAADTAERWDADLGPALLAALGPGPCDGLASVLAERGLAAPPAVAPPTAADDPLSLGEAAPDDHSPRQSVETATVGELLAAGPAVAAHVEGCDVCQDRVRAMVGVRAVLAQVPLATAPAGVRGAARLTVARRPAPLPPPIDADPGGADDDGRDRSRTRARARRIAPVGIAGLVVGLAVIGVIVVVTRHTGPTKVDTLTKVKPTTSLAVDRSEVAPGSRFSIRNTSARAVTWRVSGTERWLSAEPATGRLSPGQTAVVDVVVAPDAPSGAVDGALELTGDDGSTTAIPVNGRVARPPSLAAQLDGCVVTARAEDPDGVAGVVVHWTDPAEHDAPMAASPAAADSSYTATLPSTPRPLRWWVTAADAQGNVARTADAAPTSC